MARIHKNIIIIENAQRKECVNVLHMSAPVQLETMNSCTKKSKTVSTDLIKWSDK